MLSADLSICHQNNAGFCFDKTVREFNRNSLAGYVEDFIHFISKGSNDESGSLTVTSERESFFESIINDYSRVINRICFSYSDDADEMKDLRQDVYINIWNGLTHFNSNSSLLTWIYRVALNTCVSCVRKKNRRIKTDSFRSLMIDVADEDETSDYMDRLEQLHAMLSQLAPIDRAIMTMRLDGRSNEEIAEVTGISRPNVATRLNRIKNKLRIHN